MMGRVCPLTHVHAYVGNVCVPSCLYMCMHDGESAHVHAYVGRAELSTLTHFE